MSDLALRGSEDFEHDGAEIQVRIAVPGDAAALLQIYAPYVSDTAITFEYEVPSVEEFQGRIEATLERYPYLVAELEGRPVGYAYASGFKERVAYSWSVETSIYVDRDLVHRGVGAALHMQLEEVLRRMGITNMNACIAVPAGTSDPYVSRNSQEFHAHMGYRLVGEFVLCAQKFGRWYNMVWMEKHIGPHLPGACEPLLFGGL